MTEGEERRKELQRGPYSTMIADSRKSQMKSSKSVAAWLPEKRRKPTDWCVAGFAGSPHVFLYDLEHYPASRRRGIYDGGGKDGRLYIEQDTRFLLDMSNLGRIPSTPCTPRCGQRIITVMPS